MRAQEVFFLLVFVGRLVGLGVGSPIVVSQTDGWSECGHGDSVPQRCLRSMPTPTDVPVIEHVMIEGPEFLQRQFGSQDVLRGYSYP
jgi:hypothetical protein